MKNHITIIAASLLTLGSAAQTVSLSAPVTVSSGTAYGTVKPRIALTTGDVPVVMWGRTNPGHLYVSRFNGSTFMSPLQVTPSALDVYTSAAEGPTMAASGNTVFVSFFTLPATSSKIYTVRSTDGGATFGDTVRSDQHTSKPPYTPAVAIDDNGNPIIAYERSNPNLSQPEHVFVRSSNGGQSYSNAVTVNTGAPGEPCECCPPSIATKDSLVYVMYRNNNSNIRDMYVAASRNYGATFTLPVRVDFSNWVINGCPASGPEGVISGDSLIVAWMSKTNNQTRIFTGSMHLMSLQTGGNRKVDPAFSGTAPQRHPSITGNNDTIGVVWDDSRLGNINCYMAVSTDGGITFGPPVLINDSASLTGTQQTPHAIYSKGIFHIVYSDGGGSKVVYRKAWIPATSAINEAGQYGLKITAAPNPFTESTTLTFGSNDGKPLFVELLDISGRVVRIYADVQGTLVIEKAELAAGTYYVKAGAGSAAAVSKIIIGK